MDLDDDVGAFLCFCRPLPICLSGISYLSAPSFIGSNLLFDGFHRGFNI